MKIHNGGYMITTTQAPPANGNPGIVPPWLQKPHPPIGIYPMPEPPKENRTP